MAITRFKLTQLNHQPTPTSNTPSSGQIGNITHTLQRKSLSNQIAVDFGSKKPSAETVALFEQYLHKQPDEKTRSIFRTRILASPAFSLDRNTVPYPEVGEVNRHNVSLPDDLEWCRWRQSGWPLMRPQSNYEHWAWYNACVELVERTIAEQQAAEPTQHSAATPALWHFVAEEVDAATADSPPESAHQNVEPRAHDQPEMVPPPDFVFDEDQREAWDATAFDQGRPRSDTQRLLNFLELERDMRLGWPGLDYDDFVANRLNDLKPCEQIVPGPDLDAGLRDLSHGLWPGSDRHTSPQAAEGAQPERPAPASLAYTRTSYFGPHSAAGPMTSKPPHSAVVTTVVADENIAALLASTLSGKPVQIGTSQTPTAQTDTRSPEAKKASSVFALPARHNSAWGRRAAYPSPVNPTADVAPALRDYYAVGDLGAMVNVHSLVTINHRDFETQFSGLLPQGSLRALLADPAFVTNNCASTRYEPGQPVTFVQDGERYFNSYRPVTYEPLPGPTEPLELVLTELLGGDIDSVTELVNVLAFLVQKPGERLGYIPCFVSRASINKQLLQHLLVTLLGEQNTFPADAHLFGSQFTDWLKRTAVVLLNHVSPTKSFQERMSQLLTSPQLSLMVKGRDAGKCTNRLNLIAFARELGDLEHFSDPRRLGVFDVSEQPVTSGTFTGFKTWLEGEGKNYALHALLTRDLDAAGFDPWVTPMNTRAQEQLDVVSRSPVQGFLQEALVSQRAPLEKDLVCINDVTVALLALGMHGVTATSVLKALQELGATKAKQIRLSGGRGKPNYWVIRRHQFWATQPEGVKRAHIEQDLPIGDDIT